MVRIPNALALVQRAASPLAAMYPDPNQQHGVYGAAHGHATTSQAGPVPSAPPLPQSTFAAAPQPAPAPSQPYNPYAYSAQQPNGYNNAGAAGAAGFGGQPGGGVYAAAAAGPGYPSTQQQGYAGMQQPQPYNPMQYGGSTFMPGPPQQQQVRLGWHRVKHVCQVCSRQATFPPGFSTQAAAGSLGACGARSCHWTGRQALIKPLHWLL